MKWLKWIGIVLGATMLLLAVVPLFVSLDDFIPVIEKEASARLKEPVTVRSLRASGLPLPHVTITGITVGKAEDIKVGQVTITPDLWSLLGSTKVIRSVEIGQLVLTQKAIDSVPLWMQGDAKPGTAPAVRVNSIRLDDAALNLQKVSFGPFDAKLDLDAGGNPKSASIVARDGRLKILLKPGKEGYVVEAAAKDWQLPVGPALKFDELVIKGNATLDDADFGEIRARLYGGTLAGRLTVRREKGIRLKGDAEVSRVEIRPFLLALGRPPTLSGRLTAKPITFSASAPAADQLASGLRLETPFDVQDGVLSGVDIKKAATSLISRDGGKGGETRFDRLSGHLAFDRGTRRLTRLNIASGSLSADGNVTVSARDQLSGRVNANIQAASVASASIPLNVSGTVDSPLLLPTGTTVAGAAAGTAILGPGLGTSVGAKVGQWTEGLFGKKEEKKK